MDSLGNRKVLNGQPGVAVHRTQQSCVVNALCSIKLQQEGRCKATWKREFKLPWRKAGPPNHHDDKVDSDQWDVNQELSLSRYVVDDGEHLVGRRLAMFCISVFRV